MLTHLATIEAAEQFIRDLCPTRSVQVDIEHIEKESGVLVYSVWVAQPGEFGAAIAIEHADLDGAVREAIVAFANELRNANGARKTATELLTQPHIKHRPALCNN